MQRTCDVCEAPYAAARSTSRFCSDTCRKRSGRGSVPSVAAVTPGSGRNVELTRTTLEGVNRLDTWQGAAAMSLAERMDNSTAVMGYAALVKEHREAMQVAMQGAVVAQDPLDMVRARRDAKRNAG